MRLANELMHLGVRRQVDDRVDLRILDAADAAGIGGIVPGEVLEQRRKCVGPRIQTLVHAEDLMAVLLQADGEVRTDLA